MATSARQVLANFQLKNFLELILTKEFQLIGQRLLIYLSGSDIYYLRQAFANSIQRLILNDSFLLFKQKIQPHLPVKSAKVWLTLIQKTVLEFKYANSKLSDENSFRICNIFFNSSDPLVHTPIILQCVFRQPVVNLILYQNLGGSNLLFQLDHLLSEKQKREFYNSFNKSQYSPLHVCAQFDLLNLFKIFIPHINLRNCRTRSSNESVFRVASANSSYKILKFLRRQTSQRFKNKYNVNLHLFY